MPIENSYANETGIQANLDIARYALNKAFEACEDDQMSDELQHLKVEIYKFQEKYGLLL